MLAEKPAEEPEMEMSQKKEDEGKEAVGEVIETAAHDMVEDILKKAMGEVI